MMSTYQGLIHPVMLVSLTVEPKQGCSVTHETCVICPPAPCVSLAPRAPGAASLWALGPASWALGPASVSRVGGPHLPPVSAPAALCCVGPPGLPQTFHTLTLLLCCTRRGSLFYSLCRVLRTGGSQPEVFIEGSWWAIGAFVPLLSRVSCGYTSLKLRIFRARTLT